jgi:hypothetical protein
LISSHLSRFRTADEELSTLRGSLPPRTLALRFIRSPL